VHPERFTIDQDQFETDATPGMAHGVADDLAGEEGDDVVWVLVVPQLEHGRRKAAGQKEAGGVRGEHDARPSLFFVDGAARTLCEGDIRGARL
jgi:hypothetical protein